MRAPSSVMAAASANTGAIAKGNNSLRIPHLKGVKFLKNILTIIYFMVE